MKKIILTVALIAGLTASAQVKVGSNPTTMATNANFQVEGTTTATDQFVVLKNGNVGIGTNAPAMKFHARGEGNIAMFGYNGGANNPYIILGAEETGNLSTINANGSIGGGSLVFKSAANETMRISANGNVGIGTTTPTSKLQVVGLPIRATNAAAITAGLTAGAFYHAGDGIVRVVF